MSTTVVVMTHVSPVRGVVLTVSARVQQRAASNRNSPRILDIVCRKER